MVKRIPGVWNREPTTQLSSDCLQGGHYGETWKHRILIANGRRNGNQHLWLHFLGWWSHITITRFRSTSLEVTGLYWTGSAMPRFTCAACHKRWGLAVIFVPAVTYKQCRVDRCPVTRLNDSLLRHYGWWCCKKLVDIIRHVKLVTPTTKQQYC